MNQNLYIVTTIFNPFGFKSRYRLYHDFKKHMKDSGAKLFTVEVAFGDQPFHVTDPHDPMNLQLRTNHILWQKEVSLNLGFKKLFHVVPSAQYLGWFDADVSFGNPSWLEETVHNLSHLKIVQPFATAINLNSKEDYMWNCPSSIRSWLEGRGYHQEPPLPISYTYKGHPGLAWCITRKAYEDLGGLFETCIAGSADSIMVNALKGDYSVYLPAKPTPALREQMIKWQKRCDDHIRGQVGFTRGCILHHWHGASGDRGYEKRWSIMDFHKFDPTTDLVIDEHSGLYKWAGNKPRLEDDIRYSLSLRNEDGL